MSKNELLLTLIDVAELLSFMSWNGYGNLNTTLNAKMKIYCDVSVSAKLQDKIIRKNFQATIDLKHCHSWKNWKDFSSENICCVTKYDFTQDITFEKFSEGKPSDFSRYSVL